MALYASQAAVVTASDLYTLDEATAEATSIGATGHGFTGLAFDPTTGILYGATSNNSAATIRALYTIDPLTGASTLIAQFKLGGTGSATIISDLAFDSTGQLYGWSGTTGQIHQIDKATAAYTSPLGGTAIGVPAASISFDAADTLYYLVRHSSTENRLYTVAMSGGTLTLVGTLSPSGTGFYPAAATFDEADLLWWINSGNEGADVRLRTLDVGTLASAAIGASTDPGDNFDGLVWFEAEEVYEPDPEGDGIVFSFNERVIDPAEWTRVDDPSGI